MIRVKKLHPSAIIPRYQTPGAACFDLHALEGREVRGLSSWTFRTGLAFEVPAGHVMLVYSRSGHGFKHGIRLANSVGVVDSDYRGEIFVRLTSDGDDAFEIHCGDRIAQAMILPVHQWQLVEVDELSDTQRGTGGLGSTGA